MKNIKSIKSIIEDESGKFVKEYREYNNLGKEIIKESYLEENKIEERIITNYNDNGLISEEINYGENNELNTKTTFYYNENKR